jgi:hypothetical protein
VPPMRSVLGVEVLESRVVPAGYFDDTSLYLPPSLFQPAPVVDPVQASAMSTASLPGAQTISNIANSISRFINQVQQAGSNAVTSFQQARANAKYAEAHPLVIQGVPEAGFVFTAEPGSHQASPSNSGTVSLSNRSRHNLVVELQVVQDGAASATGRRWLHIETARAFTLRHGGASESLIFTIHPSTIDTFGLAHTEHALIRLKGRDGKILGQIKISLSIRPPVTPAPTQPPLQEQLVPQPLPVPSPSPSSSSNDPTPHITYLA